MGGVNYPPPAQVSTSRKPIVVALLGCGTVGGGVLQLLSENSEALKQKIGVPLEVAHVLVRDPKKSRVAECKDEWVTTDPDVIFNDERVDVVIEVMGGENPARNYIERAIEKKLTVVTANKLLVAMHGPSLIEQAKSSGVDLAFEAAVGGGIPIIRTLRDGLNGDRIESMHGILNGTCNYILTRMRDEGADFQEVLNDAKELGYAEADPTLDIEGLDAAQKLIIACMLSYGSSFAHDAAPTEGITAIDSLDFSAAANFGFTIKHLAVARDLGETLSLHIHPALIPKTSALANIDGVLNALLIHGKGLGPCMLMGRGAGDLPTAVSVVADLVDVARARSEGHCGVTTRSVQVGSRKLAPLDELRSRYYLRFSVSDSAGVLAKIAGALGQHDVSIEKMVQQEGEAAATLLMITHECREGDVKGALSSLEGDSVLVSSPRFIRIEDI